MYFMKRKMMKKLIFPRILVIINMCRRIPVQGSRLPVDRAGNGWKRYVMELLKKNLAYPVRNRRFSVCVVLTLILAYGFYACHYTVHIDQNVPEYYNGTYLINAGRWAAPLIHLFTNWMSFSPFWHTVVMALLLFAAAVVWSVLFSEASGGKLSNTALLFFSTIFVSYPVIEAQLTYPILNIALCYLLTPASLHLLMSAFVEKTGRVRRIILAFVFLVPAVDMYESFACVYLTGLFAILLLMFFFRKNCFKCKKDYIVFFVAVVLFLAAAILTDLLISKLLNYILCRETRFGYGPNTKIYWFSDHPIKVAKRLLMMMITLLLVAGISVPFVLLFLVSGFVGAVLMIVMCVKKRSAVPILLYMGLLSSVLSLSIVVGRMTPFRQMQSLSVFVPFVLMLIYQLCGKKRITRILISCVLIVIVMNQTMDINNYAVDNYERHTYEISMLKDVGDELMQHDVRNKPVVFMADDYQLPQSLRYPRKGLHPVVDNCRAAMGTVLDKVLPKNYFKKAGGYGYAEKSAEIALQVSSEFPAYQSYIQWMSAYYDFHAIMPRLGYTFKECSPEQKERMKKTAGINDPSCRYRITENDEFILVQFMTVE